jgi:DnaJ-class molecular chaperone
MASAGSDSEDRTEEAHEPRECMPCRGSGQLISNLGGTPSTVTCPWCEGGGVRLVAIDAQAHWSGSEAGVEQSAADAAAGESAEPPAAA